MDSSFVKEIFVFYAVYITLGFVAVIFNTILLTAICSMKQLKRNRWLVLSAALIAADTLLSLGYAIPAIITVDEFVRVDNYSRPLAKYSSIQCVGINAVLFFGSIAEQTLTLCIAIDRAIAINKVIWYRQHSDQLIKIMLVGSLVMSLTYVACSFIGVPTGDTIMCTVTGGIHVYFQDIYYLTANCLCVAIVVVYVVVLLLTRKQLRQLKLLEHTGFTDSINAKQLDKQIRVTKLISTIVFAYCFTSVPGYTMIDILPKYVDYITSNPVRCIRTLMICQLLISLNTFLNSFLYIWRNGEIRDRVKDGLRSVWQRIQQQSHPTWASWSTRVGSSDALTGSAVSNGRH